MFDLCSQLSFRGTDNNKLESVPENCELSSKGEAVRAQEASDSSKTSSMRKAAPTVYVQLINDFGRIEPDMQVTVARGKPGQMGRSFGSIPIHDLYSEEVIYTATQLSPGEQVSVILARPIGPDLEMKMPDQQAQARVMEHSDGGDALFSITPDANINLSVTVRPTWYSPGGARLASPGAGMDVVAHYRHKPGHSEKGLGKTINKMSTELRNGRLSSHRSFF